MEQPNETGRKEDELSKGNEVVAKEKTKNLVSLKPVY